MCVVRVFLAEGGQPFLRDFTAGVPGGPRLVASGFTPGTLPFAASALYPFTGTNHGHECDCILSAGGPSWRLTKAGDVGTPGHSPILATLSKHNGE